MDQDIVITDRKNLWRRNETIRVRENRIVKAFVETKYPQIYREAMVFYNKLNEKYPTKNDLRKTDEFTWFKMGITEAKAKTKSQGKRQSKRYPSVKISVPIENQDNMRLVIPLMERQESKGPQDQPVERSAQESEHPQAEPVERPAPGSGDPQAESASTIEEQVMKDTEVVFPDSLQATLTDEIPNNIVIEIMNGLREDPYLKEYFDSDLDIDMDVNEVSPLEEELLQC